METIFVSDVSNSDFFQGAHACLAKTNICFSMCKALQSLYFFYIFNKGFTFHLVIKSPKSKTNTINSLTLSLPISLADMLTTESQWPSGLLKPKCC